MEIAEKQESDSPLPVLPRLDRLDRMLQLLEEKLSMSGRQTSRPAVRKMEPEVLQKRLSNALEEVHHKGTLLERLELLEDWVLQLSLNMEEENTSRSSSSVVPVTEKFSHNSGLSSVTKEDNNVISSPVEGKHDSLLIQEESSAQASATNPQNHNKNRKQKQKRRSSRKSRGCFGIGC